MNETLLTIAVVILFIVVPFWLIKKIGEKSPIFKEKGYAQIRGMIRESLLPLGFVENQTHALVSIATYKRDTLLVELYFDYREKEYSFFASQDVQNPIFPPRQISIIFSAAQYNSEKKKEIKDVLHKWLNTIE